MAQSLRRRPHDAANREALTTAVIVVCNMSVYHSLDKGIPSEVHAFDLAHKRRNAAKDESAVRPSTPADPASARKASPANEPLAATFRWIAGLPPDIRPLALLRKYPRIANRLANCARDPVVMRAYFFELLVDHRGGRAGFPQDVQSELLALRVHFDAGNVQSDPRAGSASAR